jgi:hypothetical protein
MGSNRRADARNSGIEIMYEKVSEEANRDARRGSGRLRGKQV